MPSQTLEFRYLQVVTNALAGDRTTVGLLHWDGSELRYSFSLTAVRALDTFDDIDQAVRALDRMLARTRRALDPSLALFPKSLEALLRLETKTGDALVWSSVRRGISADAVGHYAELRAKLGLLPRLPRGRHAMARQLRSALEALALDLLPKWGEELVKSSNKVRGHYAYSSPISWKNGAWNHALPVSLDVESTADMQSNVRETIARAVTSIPEHDTPVLVAVLPQGEARALEASQEAEYMRKAIGPRARLAKVQMRVDDSALDVAPVRDLVEQDVSHARAAVLR